MSQTKQIATFIAIIAFALVAYLYWQPLPEKNTVASLSGGLTTTIEDKVLPPEGFQSQISLGDSILKLADAGAIDKEKFLALYEARGGLPAELADIFDKKNNKPIL